MHRRRESSRATDGLGLGGTKATLNPTIKAGGTHDYNNEQQYRTVAEAGRRI